MTPIVFHEDATQEANQAVDHYERVRIGLGEDFRQELPGRSGGFNRTRSFMVWKPGQSAFACCADSPTPFASNPFRIVFGSRRWPTIAADPAIGRGALRSDGSSAMPESRGARFRHSNSAIVRPSLAIFTGRPSGV